MAERNYHSDLVSAAEQARDLLDDSAPGSKERLTESQVYDSIVKNLIEEKKLELQAEREAEELKIKQDEARWNKIWGGIKVGLTAVQVGVSGWFGWNYLKANMQFGNMVGKDGKGWFDEIKRIKL